ncbi:MAG TPA: outer membrane protein transport protein [Flavipsychrobacter sp.]|nr:outer membrane protein transport protein [Flavipsychrobacter sp.]
MKKIFVLSFAGTTIAATAFGGSFQLNLQGMRQVAMGGSGVAMPWDASTIFYNPGGLARLTGIQAYGSVYLVSPTVRYVPDHAGQIYYETQKHTSTPFALYVGGPIKKDSRIGIGLGIYTPFGSSADWGDDWTGMYVTQSISLQSIFFQPTVSYRINDRISLGAGFIYGTGSVEIQKAVPVQDISGKSGKASLDGKASGIGFNAGVQIRATDDLNFGVSYRSGVRMKVKEGDATFTVPPSLVTNFPDTKFSTELPLPSIFTVGASYKATKRLTVQADVVFAGWKAYDSLKFDFEKNTSALTDTRDPRLYKNTVAIRLGANYQIGKMAEVMIGGAYDPTPSDAMYLSPDAVDANRVSLSCGIVLKPVKKLDIMAALNYTTTAAHKASYTPANMNGTYQIKSLIPALGISYSFN